MCIPTPAKKQQQAAATRQQHTPFREAPPRFPPRDVGADKTDGGASPSEKRSAQQRARARVDLIKQNERELPDKYLEADAAVLVLKVAEVALRRKVERPHEAGDADDDPAEHGLVDAERDAGAVAVEAVLDLQFRCRACAFCGFSYVSR